MTGLIASGVWLFLLTGVSYSYPTNEELHSNPKSSPASRSEDQLPSATLADAVLGSSAAIKPLLQSFQDIQSRNTMRPLSALQISTTFPAHVEYDGHSLAASPQSRLQAFSVKDKWAVQPPGPFYGRPLSTDDLKSDSSPPGLHNANPMGSFPPVFLPGRISFEEKLYEHGTYKSESEKRGPWLRYAPFQTRGRRHISRPLTLLQPIGRHPFGYRNYARLPAPVFNSWNPSVFLRV
ncbi:uncharacterized protein LOC106525466 [Austrofundulus limnaeus]|uniref:Uncharacterized protein LOC106525466 n=1 Tax=Austrofundulus limnaeus TaxID=52670 RepID=A0A2I4C5B7_AUSLI|nr:PREDICTED: uncharacterized protein LOC106525466 [Austrofundulus limnaeus]